MDDVGCAYSGVACPHSNVGGYCVTLGCTLVSYVGLTLTLLFRCGACVVYLSMGCNTMQWLLAQEGIGVNLGDTDGVTPLYAARSADPWTRTVHGHEVLVQALISTGADVQRATASGFRSALWCHHQHNQRLNRA